MTLRPSRDNLTHIRSFTERAVVTYFRTKPGEPQTAPIEPVWSRRGALSDTRRYTLAEPAVRDYLRVDGIWKGGVAFNVAYEFRVVLIGNGEDLGA